MVKAERRIKTFSSGIKKLSNNSLEYIHRLTQVLFMVEHPLGYPVGREKAAELERRNHPYAMG
jgi:cob(I)alamin adenosyltransferase